MESGDGKNAAANGASTAWPQPHTALGRPPADAPRTYASEPPPGPSVNPSPPVPIMPQFSASTAEILKRIQQNAHSPGTAVFEAKRAEVLQSYVTSDKLPTPPPIANSARKGRGGRVGTPSQLKTELASLSGAPATGATPTSARGPGRGRRGGRGGGRGGKRKRPEGVESDVDDDDDDDDSDFSTSYTPLPTKTKSGRNINKPAAFVPTLPEPTSSSAKRRKSTKTILAAQCKVCHRATDPSNNRIVFCDICNAAYHQYCHDPPIDNEVVNVLEKEWLCGPCERSKNNVVEGTQGLSAGEGLSLEQKRAYFNTLSAPRLVTLLLYASVRHPELPIFPENIYDIIDNLKAIPNTTLQPSASKPTPTSQAPTSTQVTSPPTNGAPASVGNTPRSQSQHNNLTDSDFDPAEAQILGEIRTHHQTSRTSPSKPDNQAGANSAQADEHEYDDGYDTDPPAHFPKPGQGLARTMRPESEDLQWLVDDNFEVFSHGYAGDGTGVGADSAVNGCAK